MIDSSSALQPTKYHHNHNESEERHMWSKNLSEMTQSASSPLVYKGRDCYCVIWSMTMRTQSLVFPDIACNPSGTLDIHSHSHSCTSPITPTPTPFGRKYPHSWTGFIGCFYFFASLNCSFPQAMCFLYITAQKSLNRKKSSQISASGKGSGMGNKKHVPSVLWSIHTILPPRLPTLDKYLLHIL